MKTKIPTEPIGSIPRPAWLQQAMAAHADGKLGDDEMAKLFDQATKETIHELEKTGSPVISDGEQSKPSFVTYPMQGFTKFSPNGIVIPFEDGHTRQLPKLSGGPFHYTTFASSYLEKAKKLTSFPVKQAVISCSAVSLIYPQNGVEGYTHESFLADVVNDAVKDIRSCLDKGAYNVQIDFTEARLAIKLDPSKNLLSMLIDLNNKVLSNFTAEEQKKIGVHSCPGGDHDSTHSADISYKELLPLLFSLKVGNFYLEYAAEKNKTEVLKTIKENLRPGQRVFLGVTNVLDPRVETAEEIRDLIVEATKYIPVEQLGTTDDCGFSPFGDDTSTAREIAFAKIRARIEGTKLAEEALSN
ncbi:MAG: cobalamin-independent methionine synthase II family protein [Bacteroidales bacterium]